MAKYNHEDFVASARFDDVAQFIGQFHLEDYLAGSTIVDLGGGFGYLPKKILEAYPQISGAFCVDTSSKKILEGRRMFPHITYVERDITDTGIETSTASIITTSEIFDFGDRYPFQQTFQLKDLGREIIRIGQNGAYYICFESENAWELDILKRQGLVLIVETDTYGPTIFQVRK